jgi:hypothetical protein
MNIRNVLAAVACSLLFAAPAASQCAAVPGDPMPGPFERNWDWSNNRRQLTYCFDPATPVILANAAEFAAENLSNAGLGWTLVNAHICPPGWNLRRPIPGQPDIRIRAARLGMVPVGPSGGPDQGNGFPDHPQDYEYPSDRPRPDDPYPGSPGNPGEGPWAPGKPGPGGGRMPGGGGGLRFVRPPLAYFQPGPFTVPGGRWIRSAEVVFNWEPRPPKDATEIPEDPKWSHFIDPLPGTLTYDPRITGLHELGHAIRLDHDDADFDGDVTRYPTGTRTPAVNTVIIQRALGAALASRVLTDDVVNGDLEAGQNKIADSGKKRNVMKTFAVLGQHGINPLLGLPPGSAYSYTERERATARAACRDTPAQVPPPPIRLAAGPGRWQQWVGLSLLDGADNPILPGYAPGTVGNGILGDYVVGSIPAAAGLSGELTTTVDGWTGSTIVTVHVAGATSGTAPVLVTLPFSPYHAKLHVEANAATDWVEIRDTSYGYPYGYGATICAGPLSTLDPVDCGYGMINAGFIAVDLTGTGAPPGP